MKPSKVEASNLKEAFRSMLHDFMRLGALCKAHVDWVRWRLLSYDERNIGRTWAWSTEGAVAAADPSTVVTRGNTCAARDVTA